LFYLIEVVLSILKYGDALVKILYCRTTKQSQNNEGKTGAKWLLFDINYNSDCYDVKHARTLGIDHAELFYTINLLLSLSVPLQQQRV